MKNLIRKILKEYEEEKILVVPSLKYFGDDWNVYFLDNGLFLKYKPPPTDCKFPNDSIGVLFKYK